MIGTPAILSVVEVVAGVKVALSELPAVDCNKLVAPLTKLNRCPLVLLWLVESWTKTIILLLVLAGVIVAVKPVRSVYEVDVVLKASTLAVDTT